MSLVASKVARRAAEELAVKYPYKKGRATDILKIAVELGIDIIEGEFRDTNRNNISGLLKVNGKNGRPVIAVRASETKERKRFSIAHEIGHFILHRNELIHIDSDEFTAFRDSLSSTATSVKEIQANQFAAELLMPSIEIKRLVENNLSTEKEMTDIIKEIAKIYVVSTIAATIRISTLLGMGSA